MKLTGPSPCCSSAPALPPNYALEHALDPETNIATAPSLHRMDLKDFHNDLATVNLDVKYVAQGEPPCLLLSFVDTQLLSAHV